eukprot:4945632-Ditylum_brightwellii.AAC.1
MSEDAIRYVTQEHDVSKLCILVLQQLNQVGKTMGRKGHKRMHGSCIVLDVLVKMGMEVEMALMPTH